jgi:GNAT superfamily N-acetyltransferase
MLAGSDIVVAAVDRPSDRLAGFARVITDYTYVALILDVMVAPHFRGCGIGARIMESVVAHPKLAGIRSLELVCQPDVVDFYSR